MNKLVLTLGLALSTAGLRAGPVSFEGVPGGRLPAGWVGGVTGKGQANWSVVQDSTAPGSPAVLKQSGQGRYCWCVDTNLWLQDGFVEVRFKPLSGKQDQAGGLIWRWQDGANYYVARANALEDNVTIYHTVKGVRKEYGRKDTKVTPNQWHRLRVDFKGSHFTVSFDGQPALSWDDETFKSPGAIGVWTKADSVTLFGDFAWGP